VAIIRFILRDITMATTKPWYSIPRFGLMAFCLLWAGVGIGAGVAAVRSEAFEAAETAEAASNAVVDEP